LVCVCVRRESQHSLSSLFALFVHHLAPSELDRKQK